MTIEQFNKLDKHEGDIVVFENGGCLWLVGWTDEICQIMEMKHRGYGIHNYNITKRMSPGINYTTVPIGMIKHITSPDSKDTNLLRDDVIWKQSLCFGDIVNCAPEDVKERIKDMTFIELMSLISSNESSMKKRCDAGIMGSWDVVARTLWENIELPEKKED